MAALAVVSLGVTVIASQSALSDASDVVIRGEGDLLLASLVTDLAEEPAPATAPALERALAAHQATGLRYVAVFDREGTAIAEAGQATMPKTTSKPGDSKIEGRRVRVTGFLTPQRRVPGSPPQPHTGRPSGGLLVAELEPPIIEKLRRDLARIGIVAVVASFVLLTFAIAWSRSTRRLADLEERRQREQRLVALGSMSSVMAHELRNPLASLKGHAQLLVEDLDGDDAATKKKKTKAQRVVSEAERLELLTTTLLDFVRDGPIERSAITPRDLVDRSLEDLAKDRVTVDLDQAPKAIDGDAGRLARALHNLVDNALQASTEQPVALAVVKDKDVVVITVRDHGPGLPAGSESKIFEPFMTTRVRGTGLGLAVARRIAEQHDGTLTGENHSSGGALFTLRLRA